MQVVPHCALYDWAASVTPCSACLAPAGVVSAAALQLLFQTPRLLPLPPATLTRRLHVADCCVLLKDATAQTKLVVLQPFTTSSLSAARNTPATARS